MADEEEALPGGWQTDVSRRGEVVFRSAKPQSRTVLRLLAHLAAEGFGAAPEPVGDGFAPDGREQHTFVEGSSPHPAAWSDDAVAEIGRLLRRLHDLTSDFEPGPDAVWAPWFARSLPGTRPVIGHGDLGPWNVLARDGVPVAFVDWDNAGPVDAQWELAQTAWLNAQLHDDDVAIRRDLPSADARARQLGLLLDGYGLRRVERTGFVDRMIEFAVRSAREEAALHEVGPDTESPTADGYPILWGVTWRTRAAAWMLDHRALLDAAVDPPSPT